VTPTYLPGGTRWGTARKAVLPLASVIALLAIWQVTSVRYGIPAFYPSPVQTVGTFAQLFRDGSLISDTAISVFRIATGFLIGSAAGFVLGLSLGASRIVRIALDPYVNFLRFVSSIAWIPLSTLWLGIDEQPKIALVIYACLFPVALNTYAGYQAIPRNRLRAAQALGANRGQSFWWVAMPSCIHFALQGMRIGMGGAFIAVVAAETIAANSGLGFLIWSSRNYFVTDSMFVGIFVLGILGLLADRLLVFLSVTVLGKYRLGH
jgi:ABC-type nitrate/sulfonate/bicarbonate transport system permease component